MHAEDQARIGLLMLRRGIWNRRRLLPESWIAESLRPCALNPAYGFLWWLNTAGARAPGASTRGVFAVGAGGNQIWVDFDTDIVAVLRWTDPAVVADFAARVTAALRPA